MKPAFLALCIILIFAACKTPPVPPPPPPVVEELPLAPVFIFQDMRVEKINSTMVELYVEVNLENPNEIELPQPRLAFDYKVYDASIIRSRLRSEGPLAPSSVTPIIFGIVVYYRDMYRAFPELVTLKEVPTELNLSCTLEISIRDDEPSTLKVPFILPIQW